MVCFINRFWIGDGFDRAVQGLEECGPQPLKDVSSWLRSIYGIRSILDRSESKPLVEDCTEKLIGYIARPA